MELPIRISSISILSDNGGSDGVGLVKNRTSRSTGATSPLTMEINQIFTGKVIWGEGWGPGQLRTKDRNEPKSVRDKLNSIFEGTPHRLLKNV